MADDVQDQAKKILKEMDSAAKLGKNYQLSADKAKILIKSQSQLADSLQQVSVQVKKVEKSNDDLIDSFSRLQQNLLLVQSAFNAPKETLRSFADQAAMTGDDLMKMYGAIGGLVFDKPIRDAANAVTELEGKLKELQDLEAKENPVKHLEERIKKEEDLCKKQHDCDKDKLKSLQDQLTKEKLLGTEGGKLTDQEKEKLKLLRSQKPELEKSLDLAKNHKESLKGVVEGYQRIVALLGDAFNRFVELDKAAGDFRQETGLNINQMREIETFARQVNQELAGFGVSIEESYNAAKALKDQFGGIQNVSKGQIETVALLNKNLGVTNESAAGFLQKMESVGGLTEQQAKGMAGLAAGAATAAGVPLNKVMQDVADASDETLAMMRGNVRQMTAASIQAQRLGVNLAASAKSAKGLLNFSESVNDEMEASVLLGKNLNLNYARQLAFQGDAAGAQAEILKQVRSMGDFQKMNVFQQEALAKASGYSVAELGKMLKNQEKLDKLTDKQKQAYEDATKALQTQNEETGEQLLYQAQMQSTMQQLSNTFRAFKQSAADALTPLVMVATKLFVPVLKAALVLFNAILVPVKLFGNLLYKLFDDFKLGELFDFASKKMDQAIKFLEQISQWTEESGKSASGWVVALKGVGAAIGAVMISMYLFPKLLTTIRGLFTGIKTTVSGFSLKNISSSISGLKNTVTGAGSSIGNTVKSLGSGIGKFISSLAKGLGAAIGVIGKGVGIALKGISVGLQAFANPKVALGTLVITLAIIGLAAALRIMTPALKVFADMIVALAPFVVDVMVPAINAFKEVLLKVVDVIGTVLVKGLDTIKEMFLSLPTLINSVSDSLVSIALSAPGLLIAAGSIGALTVALTAMGVALGGGLAGGVAGLFKGDTMQKLNDLAASLSLLAVPADGLAIVSQSVSSLFSNFTQLDTFNVQLSTLAQTLQTIADIKFDNLSDLSVLPAISSLIPMNIATGTTATGTDGQSGINEQIVQKLDQLITLMSNGGIAVNLDGRKVSEQLAIASS